MEELKILSIGNSFSVDTMQHMANIALALGVKKIKLGNLYVGGCSIRKHYYHASNDLPAYKYYVNTGNGWEVTPEYKISDAIVSEQWDWISIQHGTGDGSYYTKPESYQDLPKLIQYVKEMAWPGVKLAFNMTWVGESDHTHREIVSYGGNQLLIYQKIAELTRNLILPMAEIQCVSPTGTAIQNARTAGLGLLTRDGYHLSYDLGRYIAGMTFLKALTGVDIRGLTWAPEGIGEFERKVAIESANQAIAVPFAITSLQGNAL